MTKPVVWRVLVDGIEYDALAGSTVAVTLMNAGLAIRLSATGEPRSVLCGMGVCHECRVRVNGRAHQRACMTLVLPDMVIERDV